MLEFGEFQEELKELGYTVFGVSKDSIKRQLNFSKKLETTIDLLSDEESDVCEQFGVWQQKKLAGREYMGIVRSTFILDENNDIIKEYRKVRVKGHVEVVVTDCKSL